MPNHAASRGMRLRLLALFLAAAAAIGVNTYLEQRSDSTTDASGGARAPAGPVSTDSTTTSTSTGVTTPQPNPSSGFPDVPGLLTFRGNLTRTYYGQGPVPKNPTVLWSYPDNAMCSQSHDIAGFAEWCGMGWTGEPAVWERDGRTWIAFGAYDRAIHVLDAATGDDIFEPFVTGDLIKGSVTIDPNGFPLLYTGSRDDYYRVMALDRPELTELWKIYAYDVSPTKWNNDWDGSALIVDDYLFEGGENSVFHIVKLNRGTDADGNVTVAPKLVFHAPGWDQELLNDVGDDHVSIESSVAIFNDVVYFANSGGLIEGWDVSGLAAGTTPTRVFRFWAGDDIDATVVIDDEGMLYAGAEYERGNARSKKIGQMMKLDPSKPDDPLVWSIPDHDTSPAGIWATPAIDRDMVYFATNSGQLLGVDRMTGETRWTKQLPGPTWQSPVVVDNVLIESDCSGVVHAYDVSDTTKEPPELWKLQLPAGCIEATPAVWKGRIYLGSRSGMFFAIGDS